MAAGSLSYSTTKTLFVGVFVCAVVLQLTSGQIDHAGDNPGRSIYGDNDDDDIGYHLADGELDELRAEFMYPFTDSGGKDNDGDLQTDINDRTPQITKQLNFRFPYYGFLFNYTWLSLHGFLGFSQPPSYSVTYPLTFPTPDWPAKEDPSFIGPFYSKCVMGELRGDEADKRRPGVYYRIERDLSSRTDAFAVRLRERLMWDIREGMVGAEAFIPKHGVIATWKNVSFNGGNVNAHARKVTNTFQMVLVTDEVRTYAIFNYLHLGWTTHTEAGGDNDHGSGGVPAFVGFNAGNGSRAYPYLPYSQTLYIRDLISNGFVNGFPGRHIFRIDEKVYCGSCRHELYGSNLPLVFAPESGNLLGGTRINITGPCLKPTDSIRCKFYDQIEPGIYLGPNQISCIQPRLYIAGYIDLAVSIGGGAFNYKGKFFVESPLKSAETISFKDDSVYEADPGAVRISWLWHNLTLDTAAKVQISLWGYRETTITPELTFIDILEESTNNDGEAIFSQGDFMDRNNWDQLDTDMGLIQINLTNPVNDINMPNTPILWSKPVPLAWYFAPQWKRVYGANWAQRKCNRWMENDRNLKYFAAEVSRCPCLMVQALADKGRFVPDFNCDMDGNTNCFQHEGAIHCVRSALPNMDGSGQQCCYNSEGYLMLTADTMYGGNPHRAHNLGIFPYNEANKIPSMSHYYHDIVPFFSCCKWQGDQSSGCQSYRFERRVSQDCVGYQQPGAATVFGDPHIYTFDDVQYTFNGKGEFVLVRVNTNRNKLDIQGRFVQVTNNDLGETLATQLTSIAARDNTSATVEVRIRPKEAQWRYRLNVIVDGQYVYFDRYPEKNQYFKGVIIYVPSNIHNQSQVVVVFQSGAGIEVVESQGHMAARVYLPLTFMNETKGLFGNWSTDPEDDFVLPDGSDGPSVDMNDMERLYDEFGMKWAVGDDYDTNKGASLFFHEGNRKSANYYDPNFRPEFDTDPDLPVNTTVKPGEVQRACGTSYQCRYDYVVSLRRDFAEASKLFQSEFVNTKATGLQPVTSCGALASPGNGHKSSFAFTPGTQVKFECEAGYVLVGESRRWCYASGDWSWAEDGEAQCITEAQFKIMYGGIQTGLAIAVLVPLITGISCLLAYAFKSGKRHPQASRGSYGTTPASSLFAPAPQPQKTALHNESSDTPSKNDSDSGVSKSTGDGGDSLKGTMKEPKNLDGVYYTHEPLQNKPNAEFEEKEFDVSLPVGTVSSSVKV